MWYDKGYREGSTEGGEAQKRTRRDSVSQEGDGEALERGLAGERGRRTAPSGSPGAPAPSCWQLSNTYFYFLFSWKFDQISETRVNVNHSH